MRRFAPLLICVAALVVSAPALAQTPPPVIAIGVTIAGLDVGGMTEAEATSAVEAAFKRPVPLAFKGRRWSIKPTTLETTAAIDNAVTAAMAAAAGADVKLGVTVKPKRIAKYAAYLDRIFSRDAHGREARPQEPEAADHPRASWASTFGSCAWPTRSHAP